MAGADCDRPSFRHVATPSAAITIAHENVLTAKIVCFEMVSPEGNRAVEDAELGGR